MAPHAFAHWLAAAGFALGLAVFIFSLTGTPIGNHVPLLAVNFDDGLSTYNQMIGQTLYLGALGFCLTPRAAPIPEECSRAGVGYSFSFTYLRGSSTTDVNNVVTYLSSSACAVLLALSALFLLLALLTTATTALGLYSRFASGRVSRLPLHLIPAALAALCACAGVAAAAGLCLQARGKIARVEHASYGFGLVFWMVVVGAMATLAAAAAEWVLWRRERKRGRLADDARQRTSSGAGARGAYAPLEEGRQTWEGNDDGTRVPKEKKGFRLGRLGRPKRQGP